MEKSPSKQSFARTSNGLDSHYKLILRHPQNPTTISHKDFPEITDAITVEAWIESREARTEALQALVSKWTPLTTFNTFDAYDASKTSGLDTTGFLGAVFDGRYIYFSPQHDTKSRHGKVLRFDTHGTFEDPGSWKGYDASKTDNLDTVGFYGAVFDGRYVYFVPRRDPKGFHSRVLRYDTRGEFTDGKSWEAYDAGLPRSYQSAAFDGRFIYFCPGHVAVPKSGGSEAPRCDSPAVTGFDPNTYLAGNSLVLRYDTEGDFKNKKSWSTYDASNTGGLHTADYDGACFDGRYVYFVPLSTGVVLRYDTQSTFESRKSWSAYDARPMGIKLCVGSVFDGQFIYFTPYSDNKVVIRYNIKMPFNDPGSWSAYHVSTTTGFKPKSGFVGAMFDGRYVYFSPFWNGSDETDAFHGYVVRYDTQGDFTNPRSWQAHNAEDPAGPKSVGYNGGAFDGRYLYFAPLINGTIIRPPKGMIGHGRVLRYDTLGDQGSFSLMYSACGHNGGLCAAIPGARFIVNTTRGALSVSANQKPKLGRHYIAGVYDGKWIRLFIDGVLVNQQEGYGKIVTNDTDLSIGKVLNGLGHFDGMIEEVRISAVARSPDWIKTQYNFHSNHKNQTIQPINVDSTERL